MIEQSTIDRVMAAADIVDVVKDFVSLRKAGASYKGLCPFHEDRTPSFIVTPAKQLCKCFACGAGGNVVKFIQLHEQFSYPEAIRYLAKKYGIEVEESGRTDEQKERSKERESMFIVNEWAGNWFEQMLHDDPDGVAVGMTYFRGRGFRDDTIRKFHLGFCPDRRDAMSQAAIKAGHDSKWLINNAETRMGTGLSFQNERGGLTDRYRGRVIFPIYSISGRVVGFGGRVLNKATKGVSQKYVNSPESNIYSKSRELYGLYQAKQAIGKLDRCYIVEGYTDVISMHQSGIENVVASSGTALTVGQIALLHRFTSNVTMLFDGDEAGIHAALRGTDLLLSQGMNIKVLRLPDNEDPDSFARSHTADEFKRYIEEHEVDFIRFKTDILLKDCKNDPIKKAGVISDIVGSISVIPDDILRQTYAHECAQQLGMAESVIVKAIADQRKKSIVPSQATQTTTPSPTQEHQEEPPEFDPETGEPIYAPAPPQIITEEINLAKVLIRYGYHPMTTTEGQTILTTYYIASELEADEIKFEMPLCSKILTMAIQMADENISDARVWQGRFINCEDEEVASLATQALDDGRPLSKTQQILYRPDEDRLWEIIPRSLYELKYHIISCLAKEAMSKLKNPEIIRDAEQMRLIMQEYQELSSIQREIGRLLGDRVIKKL